MQGGFLIFTSLFSICFINRKLDCHHILGIILCSSGLILIYLNTLYINWGPDLINDEITMEKVLVGLILVLVAMIINGIYFVS